MFQAGLELGENERERERERDYSVKQLAASSCMVVIEHKWSNNGSTGIGN